MVNWPDNTVFTKSDDRKEVSKTKKDWIMKMIDERRLKKYV